MLNGCCNGCDGVCSPTFLPLKFEKGNIFPLACTFEMNGIPANITGFGVTMTCKTSPNVPDIDAIFQISSTSGDIILNAPTIGQFVVTIPASATQFVAQSSFPAWYEILLTYGTEMSGYAAILSQTGFTTLSGKGQLRLTVFNGPLTVYQNVQES